MRAPLLCHQGGFCVLPPAGHSGYPVQHLQ
jgi:hypothetical protein